MKLQLEIIENTENIGCFRDFPKFQKFLNWKRLFGFRNFIWQILGLLTVLGYVKITLFKQIYSVRMTILFRLYRRCDLVFT